MAIKIQETFQVEAPIDRVWRFMLEPQEVATCIPGAQLQEVVDERTFLGKVKVRIGAVTAAYEGRVRFARVDEQERVVEMEAEGRETGGGTAKGSMSSQLRSVSDAQTEVLAEANVELTGRMMQVGQGMVQAVSRQLFQQFVACVKQRLEAPENASGEATAAEPEPIRLVPLVLRALWSAVSGFVRRLTGRSSA